MLQQQKCKIFGSIYTQNLNALPFLLIFRLLEHKHVTVELLLKNLVGEVDAKLLEAVSNHDLEP